MSYAAVFTIALTALAAAGITLSAGPAQANPGPATTNQHLSSDELLAQYPAFASEYARYQPSADALAQMQQLQGLQLVVLYGSWCHDSEREVPRLLKLLQQSNVALSSLQLAPVNQQKQHPQQLHSQYNLKYTPTIIVLDNGRELGRIIETPAKSLAEDLAEIAAKR